MNRLGRELTKSGLNPQKNTPQIEVSEVRQQQTDESMIQAG